jgi:hypothetical protein
VVDDPMPRAFLDPAALLLKEPLQLARLHVLLR